MTPEVETFLHLMASMPTSMPTLAQVGEASDASGLGREAAMEALEAAMEAGLVDAAEDLGPETLFALSALGAEVLGLHLTQDSRRWADRRDNVMGDLTAEDRKRYRRPRPAPEEPDLEPLELVGDPRQMEPHEMLSLLDSLSERRPYSSDNPPFIRHFYGLGHQWDGEELISGSCPYCGDRRLPIDGYCLKCHNAGMDRLLPKPDRSRRKQMPNYQSSLKGGV